MAGLDLRPIRSQGRCCSQLCQATTMTRHKGALSACEARIRKQGSFALTPLPDLKIWLAKETSVQQDGSAAGCAPQIHGADAGVLSCPPPRPTAAAASVTPRRAVGDKRWKRSEGLRRVPAGGAPTAAAVATKQAAAAPTWTPFPEDRVIKRGRAARPEGRKLSRNT